MTLRAIAIAALAAAAIAAVGLMAVPGHAQMTARISFLIATGPSGGTYFPVGQTIAGVISNPPGAGHCGNAGACGPPGLMASARTSDGAIANLRAVDAGDADSGFVQSDVAAAANTRHGTFRDLKGPLHVAILSGLFSEQVHLVVARRSTISNIRSLRRQRVSLGPVESGTSFTAREILAADGINERDLKVEHDTLDLAAQKLESGALDAFFFVGASPVPLIGDLVAGGTARLVPIGGHERQKAIASTPALRAETISSGTYRGARAIDTIGVRALWIVQDTMNPALAYGILRALYSPENRSALNGLAASRAIRIENGARDLPLPLNPGARRFFRENGKI